MFNVLKRILSDTKKARKIYFVWFLCALISLMFYGIMPLIENIKSKLQTQQKMTVLNNNLAENIRKLSQLEKNYQKAKEYAPLLNKYLPEELGPQNYLVDFTTALSGTGFSLNKFSVLEKENILITVSLQGSGDEQLVVDSIENLKRVTKIQDISASYQTDGTRYLILNLEIYELK